MSEPTTVLSAEEMSRAIRRMSHELLELDAGADDVVLLGIITRGVPLAHRVAAAIADAEGTSVPVGELDITMYRDDLRDNPTRPVGRTVIPRSLDDAVVVLVDDVLNSGRTVQAALHAIADLGRPRRIQLMVLVDRGHRELPIQADVVGKDLPTSRSERVRVHVAELDGVDEVLIERTEGRA
ncbi:bifunctional pyr operon transcriptional regulator/uracil phosphoribosyltransferase PyrR [Tessaracoccus rhinocerotis]|uniref:Bifunctional protein PyrR n=1 Tax=Tessaracoccus rhinocerotis TaxID=1689449 RepID=A0A553K4Q4_9ACTN|nr:bifunctional pyr operon transcriptional regulator/uracil phosphoribosyltransferase PyrR [Tessaracoccus rhinocerotis]TRY19687.1 bifunctional pyr operon transcriptional regulator/uracil phosphoribosyltransferase PyrR [Tessaracoccus rhinocerotis]